MQRIDTQGAMQAVLKGASLALEKFLRGKRVTGLQVVAT